MHVHAQHAHQPLWGSCLLQSLGHDVHEVWPIPEQMLQFISPQGERVKGFRPPRGEGCPPVDDSVATLHAEAQSVLGDVPLQ
eukprot:6039813-Prorocentrum_lima.AAC.1